MIYSIARYCFRNWLKVVGAWFVLIVAVSIFASMSGATWLQQGSLENVDSTRAMEILEKSLPEQAARASDTSGKIVFEADDGVVAHQAEIEKYLDTIVKDSKVTKVQSVQSPFSSQGTQISKDGKVAFATVAFQDDQEIDGLGVPVIQRASELRRSITVEFSGYSFASFEFPASEMIGMIAALLILLVAFGSLVAAGLPIFTALVGIGVGSGLISLWTHLVGVPNFTSQVAAMISIGVGIDYALFITTRYREALKKGSSQEDACIEAMTTAGAAVLFAGITVVISLLGMLVINIDFVNGLAIGTSTAVAVMVLVAITFVPAVLGSPIGRNLDRLSLPHKKTVPDKPVIWVRWSEFIQRRAWFAASLGVTILVVLAIPLFSLRVGVSDAGNGTEKQTTKRAYDLLASGFGPGFNGPIFTVVDLTKSTDPESLLKIVSGIEKADGVVEVIPSSQMLKAQIQQGGLSENAQVTSNATTQAQKDQLNQIVDAAKTKQDQPAIVPIQIFPSTSPQDAKTTDLVHSLRRDTIPAIVDGTGTKVYLSGITAGNIDFADVMAEKVPWFIAAVLVLSFLLLMSVFRSVLVALKAVIMNILSIGAAYGVVVAIFQWGWIRHVFGVGAPGPIEPWVPMMLFAIVFGLSMDYEVFLLSKIKEEYDDTKNNAGAVTHGLAATARVITAAALIMVCVFGSFVLADDRALKLMGLGLSAAVLLDATVVRMLLVPATMELLGDNNWWIPKWLDKLIPQIHVERVKASNDTKTLNEGS